MNKTKSEVNERDYVKAVIDSTVRFMKKTYDPVMIILYGSFADNTHIDSSDIDILAFSDIPEMKRDTSMIEIVSTGDFEYSSGTTRALDAWIYPKEKLVCPHEFIHVFQGICLYDSQVFYKDFSAGVLRAREKSVKPFKGADRKNMDNWLKKMFIRCCDQDAEAYYRYNWLKQDFPELYCRYSGVYYAGPKRTLKLMKVRDPQIYSIYFDLLRSAKDIERMQALYEMITAR